MLSKKGYFYVLLEVTETVSKRKVPKIQDKIGKTSSVVFRESC